MWNVSFHPELRHLGMTNREVTISPGNAEAAEAWNSVLFTKFARRRAIVAGLLMPHGDRARAQLGLRSGDRVVDLGCGFGDQTRALAASVGPRGRVVGVDCAPAYLETARAEARELDAAATAPVEYVAADIEVGVPFARGVDEYDRAFSQFGTMFFARPVEALRAIYGALRPGGKLAMAVWRNRETFECLHVAELAVRRVLGSPPKGDHVTCGPGPFSMANADTLTDQLVAAGFIDVAITRSDAPGPIGHSLDDAIDATIDLGPAGEVVRLAGPEGVQRAREIRAAVGDALAPYVDARGRVMSPSSAWIATASTQIPWQG